MTTLTLTNWMKGRPPNYVTNINKKHAYSEVPYLGDYYLVKLPNSASNLLYHVDYWGEGRIETDDNITGFSDCYNVNHPFQLVSSGPDKGRKIPNRIPVESFTNCDTSSYITDDSVILVTVMRGTINTSCAADIARIVHKSVGKVIAYGFENNSPDIENLAKALKNKEMYHSPGYNLPFELRNVSLADQGIAFLNVTVLRDELVSLIENASYGNAVTVTKSLSNETSSDVIQKVIQRLYDINSKNIMAYAFKLWNGGAQDVVLKYFPVIFKVIFNEENVTVVNKEYQQAVELDEQINEDEQRRGRAVANDKTSSRVTWKFTPVWSKDKLAFKMYNTECDMYLSFDTTADNLGDREVWGKKSSAEDAEPYNLEPTMLNGNIVFYVTNSLYNQSIKLPLDAEESGVRLLWGHNSRTASGLRDHDSQPRFRWIISAKTE